MNQEINHREDGAAIWIPIPDLLNIVSLFATVVCLIILAIGTAEYFLLSRMVLAIGYLFIAFHLFAVAAHNSFWSRKGRGGIVANRQDFSYATGHELALSSLSILVAILSGPYIATH